MGAILYEASDQLLLLAARPPSRLQRRLAYFVMAFLLVAFCIAAPYASLQLQPVMAFIPIYATAIFFTNLMTAILLLAQFWVVRWTWLLVLASGFLFTALIFVPFLLTFPGAFAQSGLLGAGLQTASSLAICLHMGILIFLIVAIFIRGSRQTPGIVQRSPGLAMALSTALVTAFVCVLTWAILAYDKTLPEFFVDNFQFRQSIQSVIALIVALNVIALVLLWVKGRSMLDLWLMVMCCAWLIEILLGGLLAGSRYSFGWYAGRIFQMAATFIVLLLFLSETTTLYANMARASIQRRSGRQARQIAMDTMAVSIGHEINQPLTAVVTNAQAGMRQMRNAQPDLEEAHATFSDIAAEGLRIKTIIASIRTMFKHSAHDRQLLNINKVIREVLAAVELDMRLQRVAVQTLLDDDPLLVLADSGQLHQVFLNLITNALEAMQAIGDRSAVLRVTASVVADSSDIAVTVEDTGIGIPDRDSGHIFEPFFSSKSAGTGVGLTICKVIIEAHGGRLEASANKPYGTIFRVILPKGAYI